MQAASLPRLLRALKIKNPAKSRILACSAFCWVSFRLVDRETVMCIMKQRLYLLIMFSLI